MATETSAGGLKVLVYRFLGVLGGSASIGRRNRKGGCAATYANDTFLQLEGCKVDRSLTSYPLRVRDA